MHNIFSSKDARNLVRIKMKKKKNTFMNTNEYICQLHVIKI